MGQDWTADDPVLRAWLQNGRFNFHGIHLTDLDDFKGRWGMQQSIPDLAANLYRLEFYRMLREMLAQDRVAGGVRDEGDWEFDICDYATQSWVE